MKNIDVHTKVNRKRWLEFLLGSNWELKPAGGATGEAFVAHDGAQQLFLKCNSSPFLAVLSAQGIVPKLLWTRRLGSGDVITAQRWIPGRELHSEEMNCPEVAQLLSRIHCSTELLDMLKRINNETLSPDRLIRQLRRSAAPYLSRIPEITDVLHFLENGRQAVDFYNEYVVCHCDLNHNNWLVDEEEQLFLIDWDGAAVADPALDLSVLLHWYVPRADWEKWLNHYHLPFNHSLLIRMHWYIVIHALNVLFWKLEHGKLQEVEDCLQYLQQLINKDLAEIY